MPFKPSLSPDSLSPEPVPHPFHSLLQSPPIQVFGLLVLSSLIFLFRLGRGALLDWDEAAYAEVSKEILTSHDWIHLTYQHQSFFSKPPLSVWIQALLFQCFGITEFWARFESALSGIAIVLLTYAIARRLSGATAGLFAALVLLTTNQFDRVMRQGTTDAPLCFFIFLALYAYLRLREHDPRWLYGMCAAIGLGAMVKGPAVLVAPMAIGIDWLLRRQNRFPIRFWNICLGFAVTVALYAPWHIWMTLHSGARFGEGYVGYLLTPTRDISESGVGPFYYFRVILEGAFPWSLISIFAAANWLRSRQWEHSILWTLIFVVLIGYLIFPTKHQWYIVPIYPALAIETGSFLSAGGTKYRRIVKYATVGLLAMGLIIAITRLLKRQGDPFTNEEAQLATLAKQGPLQEPLLIIGLPESQLATPTAVFYSGRRASFVEIPSDLDELRKDLMSQPTADAIVQNDTISYLSQSVDVHCVSQSSSLSYVVVSRKRP
jgi:4-amino-4-deoxy-L-arabinose transferase-like glycosyltransferase